MVTGVIAILARVLMLTIVFNRYVAGTVVRIWRRKEIGATDDTYQPTVSIVVPMYNEGAGITETIESLLGQNYPEHLLDIIVVDDCSTDHSYALARRAAQKNPRVAVLRNPVNSGKRRSIIRAVRASSAEIVVSVDSDVTVDRDAVRQLVRRFTHPKIAAVGGRIDVRNKHQNWLTRMQVAKYYYSYHFLKDVEVAFQRVMCLSGCLTAYRREILMELEPVLLNRAILGVPIKYGEDRFLTRQLVKAGYLTTMTLDAVCETTVPANVGDYFMQQLRWRRSNIVDYVGGLSHVWRLNPILAINFFSLFGVLLLYPAVLYSSVASGKFLPALVYHLAIAALIGVIYRYRVRHLPESERVSAWAFLPMSILVPITYALFTPVALFTLDSTSWETRGHSEAIGDEPSEEDERASELQTVTAADALTVPDELTAATTGSASAQVPAVSMRAPLPVTADAVQSAAASQVSSQVHLQAS